MKIAITAAAAVVLAGGASAATVKAKYSGLGQNSGTYHISLATGSGTITEHVGAGALKHQVQGDSQTYAGQMLRTFCVDLAQNVVGQVRTYNIGGVASAPDPDAPTGNVGALRASYLESLYYNATQAGLIDNRGSATSAMSGQQAAAFQLVIWELAFEDGSVLAASTGNATFASLLAGDDFKVTSGIAGGVASNLDTFFAWAFNGDALGGLRAMTSQTAQDQLIVVPLPTGAGMALVGLTGLAVRRRR